MSPSQTELIQAILANRKTLLWKHRTQNAPTLPQAERRKTMGGASRPVDIELPRSPKGSTPQQPARYATYSYPNTHSTGDMWATEKSGTSLQTRLHELLDNKAGSDEKLQEVREAVKQLAEMYPLAGQDTVDPNFAFPPLPSA